MSEIKREIVTGRGHDKTVEALQANLCDLIDLSLQGKQAHRNVIGAQFRGVHLQLDEIFASVGNHNPVSEDLLIGVAGTPENHLWMLQLQELAKKHANELVNGRRL